MKYLFALCIALPFCGCQSMLDGGKKATTAQDAPKSTPVVVESTKRQQAEVGAKAAQTRLEILKNQQALEIASKQREIGFAERELAAAKTKLAAFTALEMPNKLAQARLDFQRSKDSAAEAEEELNQILVMYEGQNLDDKTKEFVVERGRRQAVARKQQIEIVAKNLEILENHDLPREQDRLQLEIARKEAELEKLRAAVVNDKLEREIKWMNAELEVVKTKADLEGLAEAKP